jgi:hypothetical protein
MAEGAAPPRGLAVRLREPVELHVADARAAAVLGVAYVLAAPLLPAALHFTCPLRALTGIPCPLCGLTTSVGAVLRLDLPAAVAANPFGIAVALVAIVLLVRPPGRLALPAWLALAAALVSWGWELQRFGLLHGP